jgi:hypothetical protein
MTSPIRWALPAIAVTATFVAVLGGPNESVSVPAATVAVGTAGLALWDLVRDRLPEGPPAEFEDPGSARATTENWFRPGSMNQASIILLLDRVDRTLVNPRLPTRSASEVEQISRLPWPQFLDYVEARLADIEASP